MADVRQREPRLELPTLRASAEGQECTLRVPGICNGRTDTTVWAHSNWDDHGKGKGLKAHDCFGCFGCHPCHDWLDRTRDPRRREIFDKARDRTLYVLFASGRLKVTK